MASKFSNGKWVTSKGDPSDMPPVFSELSPSKAAASSGVYMCPQCDYVTDREMKLSEHMKSTLLHISLVTPEVTVSPPLSTVATSSTSPTSTSGGSGCTAPILAKTKAVLTIISATLLRTEATSHKIENASRIPKDKVVEELWQHYERFHQHNIPLPCSAPIMTRMRVELKICHIGNLRSEAAAHKIYKSNRKKRGEVVEELWKHYLKYHKNILESKEPLPKRKFPTSHKSDSGGGGCESPLLAKQKVDLNIHSAELLRPEAAAHKVANASRKPKEKVVEELWQHYTQCHQQDLLSEAPLSNGLVSSSQNEETKCIKCPLCGMYYSPNNKKELEIHNRECNAQKRSVLGKKKFKCTICLVFSTNSLSDLKAHSERSHPECDAAMTCMDYTLDEALKDLGENPDHGICSSCNFMAKSTQQLSIHVREVHHLLGNNPHAKLARSIKCPHCPHIAKKLGCLQIHVELAHQNHVCTRCDFATMRFKDLGRHLQSAHEVNLQRKEYWEARKVLREAMNRGNKCVCAECNLPRMSWARTKDPEFIKELSDPDYRPRKRQPLKKKCKLKCSVCTVIQRDVHVLEEHENAHKGLRPYSCDKCEACFGSRKTLNHHVSINHKVQSSGEPSRDKTQDTVCDICKKELCSKRYKEVHMETVHQEAKLKCRFCNEVRKDLRALEGHENEHRGLTPFSCGICGVKYSSYSALNKHKKRHRYQLTEHRENNKAHIKTEAQKEVEKPIRDNMKYLTKVKCPHCDKFYHTAAQTARNIMVHLKLKHPGITNLKCPFCDLHASEFRLLDAHVDAAHKWRWEMKKVNKGRNLLSKETFTDAKCKLCEKNDFVNLLEHLFDCHNITSLNKYEEIVSTNFPKNASEKRLLPDAAINNINCDICMKKLSSNRLKKRHMKIVHDVDLSIPTCKICGKKRFRSILNHLDEGHNIKSLDEYEEIVKYLPIMTNEKGSKPLVPIQCEICDKELSTLRKKKMHMKVHIPYTIVQGGDINKPRDNEAMDQSDAKSSECIDNAIAALFRTKIEVMEHIETKLSEENTNIESNTTEALSHIFEGKTEVIEQSETNPYENVNNGANTTEALTHTETKMEVIEQDEAKPSEGDDNESIPNEAFSRKNTKDPHDAIFHTGKESTSQQSDSCCLENVKTELQEHVTNDIEALDKNEPHKIDDLIAKIPQDVTSKPGENNAHDKDVSSDLKTPDSHTKETHIEAVDPHQPIKSSCEDVQKEQMAETPKKVTKYPNKVKCPHCNHLGISKAYSSNIMLHIKTAHPEISNFKCPFCDKNASEYRLLSVHVGAAHKWRWKNSKGKLLKSYFNEQKRQRNHVGSYVRKFPKEKTPTDIKCAHCDDFVYRNAIKSNIMLHLRDNHKDVENPKCPFCDEITAGFELLMCHVKADHFKELDVLFLGGLDKDKSKVDRRTGPWEQGKRKKRKLKKLDWGTSKCRRKQASVNNHKSVRDFQKCDICEKELGSRKFLEWHMKVVHKVDSSSSRCKICHKDDFENLYKHLSECHNVASLYEYDEVVKDKRGVAEEAHNLTLPTPEWISIVDKMLGANPADGRPAKRKYISMKERFAALQPAESSKDIEVDKNMKCTNYADVVVPGLQSEEPLESSFKEEDPIFIS